MDKKTMKEKLKEKTFEEEFPSLKGKHFMHDADISPEFKVWSDSCIKLNCIDKQRVRDRINHLESMGTICHQWNANELRTLINYWEKLPSPTKAEGDFARGETNKIIERFELEFIDKQRVKEVIDELEKRWKVDMVIHPTPNDGFEDLKKELGL